MYGSNFSHKECNWCLEYESIVPKKIYPLHPFILHWPSLYLSKVSNSQKKVLITPGLYFPNYCTKYLPHDISCDFKKCKHVKLRRELTCAVFEELCYTANNQKIGDKKKVHYQEGLEKSRTDSAAQSCDSYMKDPEKSRAQSRESYMKDPEKSRAAVQHEAAKVTIKAWRRVTEMKLAWLYPTKVRKQLQPNRLS